MKLKILLVDDDERLLRSFERVLGRSFDVATAPNGPEGLTAMREKGPFAVVISDFKMPGMSGVDFLVQAKDLAPDTVRIMLTGFADVENAIAAVNDGNVFRFLTKPCPGEVLSKALKAAIRQYQLVTAERELLEQTLMQTVEVLSEVLALINSEAFEKAARTKRYVRYIAEQMDAENLWSYEIAAMLSQLGCILLSDGTLRKIERGEELTPEEEQTYNMHPSIAHDLLGRIPRLEDIARMIAYQNKGMDGSGTPVDGVQGEDIPLGARILRAVLDYDANLQQNKVPNKAFAMMEEHSDAYDPMVLYYLECMLGVESRYRVAELPIADLQPGMIAHEDIRSVNGPVVVRKSLELSEHMIQRLRLFAKQNPVKQPVAVLIP
ncbi:MAG: response regulator [Desulfovibrionaceae bacterium]|jgi:response regulator RpfG family c-di-GMP phosphodiesterase|nr:response regulator [Desulfovibrionaceae bacterium]